MDKQLLSLAILTSFGLEIDDQGWTKLLPFGQFRAGDGRPTDAPYWYTDDAIGTALAADLNTQVNDVLVDYEHQTLYTQKNGQPAPASGWVKPGNFQWRTGQGLYAKIAWTTRASAYIEDKEYKYLSPVFLYDKTGKVKQYLHTALTNIPALDNLGEVTAALSLHFQQPTEPKPMDDALKALLCKLLGLGDDASETQITAALTLVIDKMTDGKGLAACNTTLQQFIDTNKQQIVALTADTIKPDPAQYVEVSVMKAVQDTVAALTQKLAQREQQEADALIQVALSDGRLLPAQKDWAESLVKTNMAALTAFLDTATPIAALTKTQTDGNPPAGANAAGGLTDSQLAVCKNLGISPEEYKKSLEEK